MDILTNMKGGKLSMTCEDLFSSDPSLTSGNFTIDPDGDGPIEPFLVFCDTAKS